MKNLLLISILILSLLACKKTKFSPEGPTDVRVRNLSDVSFNEVIVRTSDNILDVDTIGNIGQGAVSEYSRFTKAHPKAEISARINVDGTMVKFSTGPVNYTYMHYIGLARITFEIYISNMNTRELTVSNLIPEEPLVLK